MANAGIDERAAKRPLSPHLTIFRPWLTMAMSMAHRITGVALYAGMALLARQAFNWAEFRPEEPRLSSAAEYERLLREIYAVPTALPPGERARIVVPGYADFEELSRADGIEEAIKNYQASITDQTPAVEKVEVLGRLIRLLGIERKMPDKARELLDQVEATVKGAELDEKMLAAYRRAVIAAGDALLWHAKPDDARALYKRAEVLGGARIPLQVRVARTGSYPNAIREYLDGGNYEAALGVVDRWEETFPTDKPKGQTFFWRGKVLFLRGQHKEAARYLARAVGLAVGAFFESEARWLLALSLEEIGRKEEARRELAKLVAAGVDDPFTKMAREKLEAKSTKKQAEKKKP